eukprot:13764484-Ditylum_brightwellii.AAC.1
MAAVSLTIHPPLVSQTIQCRVKIGVCTGLIWMWGLVVITVLVVAVVLAVFVAAAMASLALAKHQFAAQLIVAFVVSMI